MRKPKASMPTCFLVLGTPRSGTSLVAGILHRLGVRMGLMQANGKYDWPDADDWNAKGYYQDSAFVNFGVDLFGFPPANPRRLTSAERTTVGGIIDARAGDVDWGVKEPTIAFYLADFVDLCPDPVKLIVAKRVANRSIQSWRDRSGDSLLTSTTLIELVGAQVTTNVAASLLTTLTVQFDDLIDDTTDAVTAIANFVGKPVNDDALNFPDESLRNY